MSGKGFAKLALMQELGPDTAELRDLFVNLTHNPIVLILSDDRFVRLEPIGFQTKLKTEWSEPRGHSYGFMVVDGTKTLEKDLPEPQDGVILIVTDEVASLERHRDDVFAPGYDEGLDETGSTIVRTLFRYK